MARTSATKKQTTTTSATVDETIVAENSQNVVVDDVKNEEKLKTNSKTKKVNEVEDVEETEEVVKPLEDTDEIEVVSLIPNISYKDNKTFDFYEWKNIGDIEEIPFEVLKNMYRNNRGYFRNLWIKPLDDRVIEKFRLRKLYESHDKVINIENYTMDNIVDICEEIHKLPNSSKLSVLALIRNSVDEGKIQDIRIIKLLQSNLKISLI